MEGAQKSTCRCIRTRGIPQRPNSSVDHRRSEIQSGRNSQGSVSCPETFRTYAGSPIRDSPYLRSRSNSRSSSRTEILRPGQWTIVTSQVKFRALTPSEQQEVFETQKKRGYYVKNHRDNSSKDNIRLIFTTVITKMDEGADVSGGTQTTELISRVPDSPGSRSNYGEFYWDTNGENVYHVSDSFDSDMMLEIDSYGKGVSAARLDRTQEDLNKYRQRIDANVQEYRRHIADLESRMASRRSDEPSSFTLIDSTVYPDAKYKDETLWSPKRGLDDAEYQLLAKLDEERRRVDDYRIQLEQERIQNDQLLHENERLRQQFETNMRENERVYKTRERNLAQYLSEEQKKMMDLWTELQRVRRQLIQHREQTEHDLENQRNEFTRTIRNVGGLTRQLNLAGVEGAYSGIKEPLLIESGRGGGETITQDTLLIEAIKRIRESQQNVHQPGLQMLDQLKLTSAVTSDTDLYNELMKSRYEECIERNIELESKGDEAQRKNAALEAELQRTKERLSDNQLALRKLHELAQDASRGPEREKRTRSLSPGGTPLPPSEALRSVRNIIRNKDSQIQQLERKLKVVENQVKEFVNKYEHADEARRYLDKHLAESKRDLTNQIKSLDDAERQIRRLEERLRAADLEKAAVEKARKFLEEEINKLHQQYQKATAEEERKARDKEHEINLGLEEEYKNRINELKNRIEMIQRENTKLKTELNTMRDKYRDTENEYNITLRKLEEKDVALRHLDEIKRQLTNELDLQRTRYDTLNSEFDKLNNEYENANKTIATSEQTLHELSRQIFDLKHQLDNEKATREEAEKQRAVSLTQEIEKFKLQITDYENQLSMLRRHNDELDTQIKSGQAKITAVENDLITSQKEIARLNELNNRLQREKQDAINQKLKAESDAEMLKEQIRKLEMEIEKLRTENRTIAEQEERTRDALTKETNRAHLLQKELEEAKMEIEELLQKIKRLEQETESSSRGTRRDEADETDKISLAPSGPTVYDTEILEIKIREVNDKWKFEFDKLLGEKDELERKIRDLEDQIIQKNREIERQESEITELKRKHQEEIDRLKIEISQLHDKHQNDLDDEREQYNKNLESIKLVEDELRNKLAEAERKLAEAQNRENQLEREKVEIKEKYEQTLAQIQKLKDDLEDARQAAESEIQKWKTEVYTVRSELKAVETANNALKTQLATANERAESLNKTVNDQNSKIRDLNMQIRRLEEEVSDLKSAAVTRESDLESALGRLRSVEDQYATLQSEHAKTRNELEILQREYDLLKSTNTNQEFELERLRNKIQQYEVTIKEQKNALDHLKAERERLQNIYRDKVKQLDHLTQLAQSFDAKMNKMRQNLRDTSDKLVIAETERNALRSEVTKLQQELQFGKDQMVRRTDEYQSSLEDLANAHRAAEDGRLNALQELESRKYELADLKSRFENTEQRLTSLQHDYNKVENERDIMADSLKRFYSVTTHAVTLHKVKEDVDRDQLTETEIPRSIPFPPSIDYTSTEGRTGATTINIGETLDINQLENTLQTLISRIERLERERNEYREAFDRLKKKTSDTHTTIHKQETRYKTIEENLTDMEEEKRALEVRLASAKQLLRSQEEALKQRDEERRQLKAKMVAADLEARGKMHNYAISTLALILNIITEQLKNLRNDLETAQTDLRTLREREEQWDANRFQLESKLRDKEGETQRLTLLQTNLENEKQSLNERIKELSGQLQLCEIKCTDMKEDMERLKRELSKAESVEMELRKTSDYQSRTISEYQILRDQITGAQNDLANVNNQKQQLEHELTTARGELRDFKQRVRDLSGRVSDLQRQLQDAHAEKNRLEERLLTLEKVTTSQRATEDDLRQQIETCKNERRTLQRELDELKRRLTQLESEKEL
ncbi:Major antigen [Dirofilaria immitis]|nr:Major antigen [Dirofilaria immitis]